MNDKTSAAGLDLLCLDERSRVTFNDAPPLTEPVLTAIKSCFPLYYLQDGAGFDTPKIIRRENRTSKEKNRRQAVYRPAAFVRTK